MPGVMPAPAQPAFAASPFAPPAAPPDSRRGTAIAGLVLGILSVFAAILPICGLPFAVAGIVVSVLGRRSPSLRTMATVGLVLSIAAIVLALINAAAGVYLALHTHAA
jgi:hypothetical protein